jgi:hypothetical protein
MAKNKQPKQIKELDLFKDIIPSADMGIKELWDAVSDNGRKEIKSALWVLNRFMSSVKTNNLELEMHYLLTVNEYYNKHWFSLQKHPKLAWLCLCVAAHESKQAVFHESIPLKTQQDKKMNVLLDLFPNMKIDDVSVLSELTSNEEIKNYCEQLGWDKKQINELKL